MIIKDKAPELQGHIIQALTKVVDQEVQLPEVRCYSSLGSTMDCARELLQTGINCPLIVLAEQQTSGRGRQGRSWSGLHSGLYATIVFSAPSGSVNLSGYSLMVGLTLLRSLSKFTNELQLKWPNDLLDRQGRKLAGVLIETTSNAKSIYILTGIGLNISGSLPAELNAVTLEQLKVQIKIEQLLIGIYVQLSRDWAEFKKTGFNSFRADWLKYFAHSGRMVEIKTGSGVVTGKAVDLDSTGALVIEEANGAKRLITCGDVNAI